MFRLPHWSRIPGLCDFLEISMIELSAVHKPPFPPLVAFAIRGRKSKKKTETAPKPPRKREEQLKHDLVVLFSSKFIFNPRKWDTCGFSSSQITELSLIPSSRWAKIVLSWFQKYLNQTSPWIDYSTQSC